MWKTSVLLPFAVFAVKSGGNNARRILVTRLYREPRTLSRTPLGKCVTQLSCIVLFSFSTL
uniref:Uncharacterized protein n=1 Tax=Setaria viridis TaxID=4556 RepID=A0A4U6UIG4_SETVI|nr:hypothetical protein SEVIR_5G173050v2 [Setaria viridis]